MQKFKTGLVVGKFYPPHLGHSFLINKARENSEEVYVLVCEDTSQLIPAERRRGWLQKVHTDVKVLIIPDIYQDGNSLAWAEHTKNFLGFVPEAVFTSEDYGHAYAKFMGSAHIQVDKDRVNVPISATKVRNNLRGNLNFLHRIIKRDFVRRVVVLGAESTGTTTLSKSLAEHFKTSWVPEFGRIYSESLPELWDYRWTESDFSYIAKTQNEMEDKLAESANELLICDTDSLATQLWEERYLGRISGEVINLEQKVEEKLYIVTGDEIPFVQDGFRDGEEVRHKMHQRFIDYLTERKLNFVVVKGDRDERLVHAVKEVEKFLDEKYSSVFKV